MSAGKTIVRKEEFVGYVNFVKNIFLMIPLNELFCVMKSLNCFSLNVGFETFLRQIL